jgi:copper chaperone CopZ
MRYIYTLDIKGMRCGMCESHINSVIRDNFQVLKVKTSHRKGKTIIETAEPIDEDELVEVINNTGYIYQGLTKEINKK